MKILPAVLVVLASLVLAPRAYCGDAKAELEDLVERVQAKVEGGMSTEQDLAPELKAFDGLLAEHKAEKTDDVADILLMKGMLYAQIFDDFPKATEYLRQLKTDFPATEDAKKVDLILTSFENDAEAKKIHDALVVGAVFPDFQEVGLDGKPLSLANEKGRIVLIDFWATWCVPCVEELPNLLKVYAKDHARGFDIIGVSLDSDKDRLLSFIKQRELAWPQYFDGLRWENKLAKKYGVHRAPANFLVGKDGKIIGKDLLGPDLNDAVTLALAAAN